MSTVAPAAARESHAERFLTLFVGRPDDSVTPTVADVRYAEAVLREESQEPSAPKPGVRSFVWTGLGMVVMLGIALPFLNGEPVPRTESPGTILVVALLGAVISSILEFASREARSLGSSRAGSRAPTRTVEQVARAVAWQRHEFTTPGWFHRAVRRALPGVAVSTLIVTGVLRVIRDSRGPALFTLFGVALTMSTVLVVSSILVGRRGLLRRWAQLRREVA